VRTAAIAAMKEQEPFHRQSDIHAQ
jgi:hypothetical protein